jgi:hypothetical protein
MDDVEQFFGVLNSGCAYGDVCRTLDVHDEDSAIEERVIVGCCVDQAVVKYNPFVVLVCSSTPPNRHRTGIVIGHI